MGIAQRHKPRKKQDYRKGTPKLSTEDQPERKCNICPGIYKPRYKYDLFCRKHRYKAHRGEFE